MSFVFRRWRETSVMLLVATAIVCGYLNAQTEELSVELLTRFTLGWAVGPTSVLFVYLIGVWLTKKSALNYTEAFVLSLMYTLSHLHYALNGPSWRNGPDNAAQMHLVLEPFFLGVPTLFVVAYMLWRVVRATQTAHYEDVGHAKSQHEETA